MKKAYWCIQGKGGQSYRIVRHKPDWMRSPIKSVVFWTFCDVAKMSVEIMVHWTRTFDYVQSKAPGYHTIKAVLLENGDRIEATTYSLNWQNWDHSPEVYAAAPAVAKGPFRIATLVGRATLLEVVGVNAYGHSRRDEAANAELLRIGVLQRDEFEAEFAGKMGLTL